jgi:FixJ family two-component response regulator
MPRKPDPWPPFVETVARYVDAETHAEALPLLDQAIEQLHAVRDRDLLDAIAHGDRHEDIAAALGVSRQAVTQQVRSARAREIARRQR